MIIDEILVLVSIKRERGYVSSLMSLHGSGQQKLRAMMNDVNLEFLFVDSKGGKISNYIK